MEEIPTMSAFQELLRLTEDDLIRVGDDIPIPRFPKATLSRLIDCYNVDIQEPLLYLSGNYVVVGDIHGNLFDLLRIFIKCGIPPENQYIFLGDYVDRGGYSLEVISLLLALHIQYPHHVILLRGNHEFQKINRTYGFYDQIQNYYQCDELWEKFNMIFNYFPLACILNGTYFLVHGGIESIKTTKIENISKLKFPITNYEDNNLVTNLVWADPSEHESFSGIDNQRGAGQFFGRKALANFLKENKLSALIRGHQCVDGIEAMWNRTLLTVFSSSKYGGDNSCGILRIYSNKMKCSIFPLVPYVSSEEAFFYNIMESSKTLIRPKSIYITARTVSKMRFIRKGNSIPMRRKALLSLPICG